MPSARVLQVPAMATEEGLSLFSKVITCGRGGMRRKCKRLQRAAGRRIEGLQTRLAMAAQWFTCPSMLFGSVTKCRGAVTTMPGGGTQIGVPKGHTEARCSRPLFAAVAAAAAAAAAVAAAAVAVSQTTNEPVMTICPFGKTAFLFSGKPRL